MTIQENVLLAPFTTFHIGGPARCFARASSVEELQESLSFAKAKNLRVFVLGGGSNVLIDDKGFDGLVIKIELTGVEEKGNILIAAAGENWDELVKRAVSKNLWGIENLSGIPGTVGGAVVQNIGAYGQALSQTLTWVEAFDNRSSEVIRLPKEELKLGYRTSVFKEEEGRYIVLKAALILSPAPTPELSYKDLTAWLEGRAPGLQDIREAVLDIRRSKFPDVRVEGTAGSFFKNPIVSEDEAVRLREQYPQMPLFSMPETSGVKVPLAWLLDHVLRLRGFRVGGARLFERQPLVVAAERGASSHDVCMLAEQVADAVREAFQIELEPEVRIL